MSGPDSRYGMRTLHQLQECSSVGISSSWHLTWPRINLSTHHVLPPGLKFVRPHFRTLRHVSLWALRSCDLDAWPWDTSASYVWYFTCNLDGGPHNNIILRSNLQLLKQNSYKFSADLHYNRSHVNITCAYKIMKTRAASSRSCSVFGTIKTTQSNETANEINHMWNNENDWAGKYCFFR